MPRPLALVTGAVVFYAACLGSTSAAAQTGQDDRRVTLSVGGGYQPYSPDLVDNTAFTTFAEAGDFDANYGMARGRLLDVGGSVRLWRRLAIGATFSNFKSEDRAAVSARIPHPFLFERHRDVAGLSGTVDRTESAVHLHLSWAVLSTQRLALHVLGGPTYFDLSQDLVTEVEFSDSYPYDAASFVGTLTEDRSESAFGFNAGVETIWYLSRRWGVGWVVRFSRGQVDLSSPDGGTVAVDAGGVHSTAGLRLRF